MKKIQFLIFPIIISLLCFSACGNKESKNDTIPLETGIYYDKNWDEPVGSYKQEVIPDKETAIEVAKTIFSRMEKSKEAQEYTPQSIFYDEQDEVWIISFGKDLKDNIVGGGCSIAIEKKGWKSIENLVW